MITILQSLSGTYFSANVPDVVFSIGGYRAAVTSLSTDHRYTPSSQQGLIIFILPFAVFLKFRIFVV